MVGGAVTLAPSGVEEAFFAVEDSRRQADLVAYAGGLGPWKGMDLLLQAIAQVPRARLEVLGGRPDSPDWRRLQGLAAGLGLEGRFIMRSQAGQDQVRKLLGRAAIAVWPGTARQRIAAEFTSPLKLFEYLAAGCAVVCPEVPAARAVVTTENACLFAPDDPLLAQAWPVFWLPPRRLAAWDRPDANWPAPTPGTPGRVPY
ncbi:hypothetical protein DFAR_3610019 [Desulfarculales bacterium]